MMVKLCRLLDSKTVACWLTVGFKYGVEEGSNSQTLSCCYSGKVGCWGIRIAPFSFYLPLPSTLGNSLTHPDLPPHTDFLQSLLLAPPISSSTSSSWSFGIFSPDTSLDFFPHFIVHHCCCQFRYFILASPEMRSRWVNFLECTSPLPPAYKQAN